MRRIGIGSGSLVSNTAVSLAGIELSPRRRREENESGMADRSNFCGSQAILGSIVTIV